MPSLRSVDDVQRLRTLHPDWSRSDFRLAWPCGQFGRRRASRNAFDRTASRRRTDRFWRLDRYACFTGFLFRAARCAFGHAPSILGAFATLVLEAAYEATLLAGALLASHGGSNMVLLTLLSGGAFGDAEDWIFGAIERAINKVENLDLDIRIVSYGAPSAELLKLARTSMGLSETANFRHAFRRWKQTSPLEYRRSLMSASRDSGGVGADPNSHADRPQWPVGRNYPLVGR